MNNRNLEFCILCQPSSAPVARPYIPHALPKTLMLWHFNSTQHHSHSSQAPTRLASAFLVLQHQVVFFIIVSVVSIRSSCGSPPHLCAQRLRVGARPPLFDAPMGPYAVRDSPPRGRRREMVTGLEEGEP